MHAVVLPGETDFSGFRAVARDLLARAVPPERVAFSVKDGTAPDLFAGAAEPLPPPVPAAPLAVPRSFLTLAETVVLHRDPERFARLYRLVWRLRTEPQLMRVAVDPDVAGLEAMAKAVRRDAHKMRAFVRFRRSELAGEPWFVAWFEPDHRIVAANAPFFMRRFASMRWSILTPDASVHWDGEGLAFGPGSRRADAPTDDALEALWRGYYANIFNPARLKVGAMRAEMPEKYWRNLPEAPLIRPLIAEARRRSEEMVETGPSAPNPRPHRPHAVAVAAPAEAGTLDALAAEAAGCRACPLWEPATQTVFGEGREDAPLLFVGEQPGDQEDIAGRPFVGPAGKLFDRALAEAGVDRDDAYVTNAVKHFKFVPRGKRRIHQKPSTGEVRACEPWLKREIALVRPRLIVALGATAALSVLGRPVPVGKSRGRIIEGPDGTAVLVTVHPSYLLRLPDAAAKAAEYAAFVDDLRLAGETVGGG
jgi:probable DNA metabolism protein